MEKTKQTNLGESKTQEINSTKSKASSRISRLIAKKTFLKWHVSKKKGIMVLYKDLGLI